MVPNDYQRIEIVPHHYLSVETILLAYQSVPVLPLRYQPHHCICNSVKLLTAQIVPNEILYCRFHLVCPPPLAGKNLARETFSGLGTK